MFVYVHGTVTAKYFPVPSFRPIWAFPAELWAHDYAGDRLVRELEQFGDLNRVQRDKVPYRTEFQVNLSISGRVMSSRRRRWPTGSRAGTFLRSSSCSACQSTLTYRVSSQSEHFRPSYEPKTIMQKINPKAESNLNPDALEPDTLPLCYTSWY